MTLMLLLTFCSENPRCVCVAVRVGGGAHVLSFVLHNHIPDLQSQAVVCGGAADSVTMVSAGADAGSQDCASLEHSQLGLWITVNRAVDNGHLPALRLKEGGHLRFPRWIWGERERSVASTPSTTLKIPTYVSLMDLR